MNCERVIFDHTPKAGGTSVLRALEKALKHQGGVGKGVACRVSFASRQPDGRRVIAEEWPGCVLYSSHYAFRAGSFRSEPGECWITWARDPVDMFWSVWHYTRSSPGRPVKDYEPRNVGLQLRWAVQSFDCIEDYIDWLLALRSDVPPVFPQGVMNRDWGAYDFVGLTAGDEITRRSYAALSSKLGVSVSVRHDNRSSACRADRSYRREELEKFFWPEMQSWERAKEVSCVQQ